MRLTAVLAVVALTGAQHPLRYGITPNRCSTQLAARDLCHVSNLSTQGRNVTVLANDRIGLAPFPLNQYRSGDSNLPPDGFSNLRRRRLTRINLSARPRFDNTEFGGVR